MLDSSSMSEELSASRSAILGDIRTYTVTAAVRSSAFLVNAVSAMSTLTLTASRRSASFRMRPPKAPVTALSTAVPAATVASLAVVDGSLDGVLVPLLSWDLHCRSCSCFCSANR